MSVCVREREREGERERERECVCLWVCWCAALEVQQCAEEHGVTGWNAHVMFFLK